MRSGNNRVRHCLLKYVVVLCFIMSFCILDSVQASQSKERLEVVLEEYQEYQTRIERIRGKEDIAANGFRIIEGQVFPVTLQNFGEVTFIPAMDPKYNRLILCLAKEDGRIVYKTDQLETNNRNRGELKQPNKGIAAVSFQDMDGDERKDIVLITFCVNETKSYREKGYKIGDVLFQNAKGFYRDYRLSDKINRYGMNKSIRFITSFIRDGYSTEFLYTATTIEGLLDQGLTIVSEQSHWSIFEKLGGLWVVPGVYRMAEYSVFMIYMVNEQGNIVWSFQPMGDYEHLYALQGVTCKDIDGDGLKDVVVLARYSYEGSMGETVIESDSSIYYQRTGGFYPDNFHGNFKSQYRRNDSDTLEHVVKKARIYWGWTDQDDKNIDS